MTGFSRPLGHVAEERPRERDVGAVMTWHPWPTADTVHIAIWSFMRKTCSSLLFSRCAVCIYLSPSLLLFCPVRKSREVTMLSKGLVLFYWLFVPVHHLKPSKAVIYQSSLDAVFSIICCITALYYKMSKGLCGNFFFFLMIGSFKITFLDGNVLSSSSYLLLRSCTVSGNIQSSFVMHCNFCSHIRLVSMVHFDVSDLESVLCVCIVLGK